MGKGRAGLTGSAGEYFVAYQLSALGYVAALPRGGAMGVDILVTTTDASRTAAIQVKSTDFALRNRGRGNDRSPFELQFPLGFKSSQMSEEALFFAFVDFRWIGDLSSMPDVYVVPSEFVRNHCASWAHEAKMVRFHIEIRHILHFKNNWSTLETFFSQRSESAND